MSLLGLNSLLSGKGSKFTLCKSWTAWACLVLTLQQRSRLNNKIFSVFKYGCDHIHVQLNSHVKVTFRNCSCSSPQALFGWFLSFANFERCWHVPCHLCQTWGWSCGPVPELTVWVTAFISQHSPSKMEAPSVLQSLEVQEEGLPHTPTHGVKSALLTHPVWRGFLLYRSAKQQCLEKLFEVPMPLGTCTLLRGRRWSTCRTVWVLQLCVWHLVRPFSWALQVHSYRSGQAYSLTLQPWSEKVWTSVSCTKLKKMILVSTS